MADEKVRDKLRNRGDAIDDAVAAAEGTLKDRDAKAQQGIKGVLASDNPHKPGSTLHKLWERKRQAGELKAQEGK